MTHLRFSFSAFSHKWHKRLMYVVGIQFFVWALSGLYMVSINIHGIHGDDRVTTAPKINIQQATYPINRIMQRFPSFIDIKLKQLLERPVMQIVLSQRPYQAVLIDAQTGEQLPTLTPRQIEQIAQNRSAFSASITSVTLLTELPEYVTSRFGSAYDVSFDTWDNLHFYIQASTGEVITKRHSLWHIFDWMWRLHIMDYADGENIHNYLLQIVAIIGIVSVSFGTFLLCSRRRFLKQKVLTNKSYYQHVLVIHKWIATLVFVQLIIWLGSGLYLSLLEKPKVQPLPITTVNWQQAIKANVSFASILNKKSQIIEAKLHNVFGKAYVLYTKEQGYHRSFSSIKHLVSLPDGISKVINQVQIEQYFAAINLPISKVQLLASDQSEIRGEMNAVWQVTDEKQQITYYFDAQTGQVIANINFSMRIHDLMLRLHFMDYFSEGHFNHAWNILFSTGLLIISFTGLNLCWRRLLILKNKVQKT